MFVTIAIITSIIGLLIATYTDLKERIVPNKLNFGLAGIGLIIFGTQSIITNSFMPIAWSLFGMVFGFCFGWVLWKLGVFAGGDVKLFMALGALNPFTPMLFEIIPKETILPIFPISLFINSLIGFMPYGITIIAYKLMKNKKERKKIFSEVKEKTIEALHTSLLIAGAYPIAMIFTENYLVRVGIIFGILIIWNLLRERKKFLTILFIIVGVWFNHLLFLEVLGTMIFMLVIFFGIIKIMFSARRLLSEEKSIQELEEGMIPKNSLVWEGKRVVEKKESFMRIVKKISEGKFGKEKEIISSKKARGLTEEEIKELKKLSKKGLIKKSIKIKDSMPFVPAILFGYAISLILGDTIIYLLIWL